jgi:hypothetical protein
MLAQARPKLSKIWLLPCCDLATGRNCGCGDKRCCEQDFFIALLPWMLPETTWCHDRCQRLLVH